MEHHQSFRQRTAPFRSATVRPLFIFWATVYVAVSENFEFSGSVRAPGCRPPDRLAYFWLDVRSIVFASGATELGSSYARRPSHLSTHSVPRPCQKERELSRQTKVHFNDVCSISMSTHVHESFRLRKEEKRLVCCIFDGDMDPTDLP
jgi:hypothetical protein